MSGEGPSAITAEYVASALLGLAEARNTDARSGPAKAPVLNFFIKKKPRWDWLCDWCDAHATCQKRAGPRGRQTLCNRCGLRYAKELRNATERSRRQARLLSSTFGHREAAYMLDVLSAYGPTVA